MTACKWTSRETPRVIPGRHTEDCADRYGDDEHGCAGCLPCTEDHCVVCRRVHATGACPECVAATRADLHEIARLCDALPEEVEHRGVEGEAMMLLGPVSDPEAWGHVQASVYVGRLPKEWIEQGGDERHPLTVLLSWAMTWRDALDHDEAPDSTLETAVDYVDRTLGYMATHPELEVPFQDFATDVRRCAGHLEAVLHDGEQVDRGAPCMTCGLDLQRIWKGEPLPWSDLHPQPARHDGWACRRCRTTSTEAQYDLAVKADYIARAEWLPAEDMTTRTGVKASTVRSWASDKRERGALIRKTLRAERVVYSVEDVERERERAA